MLVRILAVTLCMISMVQSSNAEIDNRAIVKIFVTSTACNPDRPWMPDSPIESTGTGFIIEQERVLTNAHVVEYATYIMVQRGGDSKKYRAFVQYVSHQADLAILHVADDAFYNGITPLAFGQRPQLKEQVTVVGYPSGGEEQSYTSGIVSRIEVNSYAHSGFPLLTVQVDAAMNPGNSGGPALHGDAVVGVAMMGDPGSDGVGYLIPTEVISHFLEDIRDGKVDGYPSLSIHTMQLENEMQRRFYQMDSHSGNGILVCDADFEIKGGSGLMEDDIIIAIDQIPVHANKKVRIGKDLLLYTHPISMKQVGDIIELSVIRDGKQINVEIVAQRTPDMVPYRCHDIEYPYTLIGGYIFTPLYYDFISTYGDSWPDPELYGFTIGLRTKERRQIVFLHTILNHELTSSVSLRWHVVKSVNGEVVVDFGHFESLITQDAGWIDIEFDSGAHLRLKAEECRALENEIVELYSIPWSKS